MKKVIVIAMLASLVGVAQADYNVGLNVGYGVRSFDGSTGLLPNVNDEAVLQLIYVGENGLIDYAGAADKGDLGDISSPLGKVAGDMLDGDDILLGMFSFRNAGGSFQDEAFGASQVINGAYIAGSVYGRIIGAGDNGVTAGDWFWQGAVFDAKDMDMGAATPPLPEDYAIDNNELVQASSGQVIPEPATFGLMGVAALGMFLARKKARR